MRRMLFCLSLLSLSVLPLSADEALHGSWQGRVVDEEQGATDVVLTFEAGGAFTMDQRMELGADFQAIVQASQIPVENMTARGTGTWEADGDRLRVSIPEMVILVDGRDYLEVLGEVAAALGHIAADLAGISDADRPAFVAVFVNDFLASISEEQFLLGFNDEVTWAVEGETLSITTTLTDDGSEETYQYQRVAGTSVEAATWGGLKARAR